LATPEVAPRAQRLATTAALRATGELQRQQAALGERIASLLPRHGVGDKASREETDEPLTPRRPVDLQPLVPSQEAITGQLRKEVETIAQLSREAFGGDHGQQIRTAAEAALAQSQRALDDLQQQRVDTVDDSQRAADEALGELLNTMKNHVFAAHIGLVTILAILLWQGFVPRRLRLLPAPLVAVIVATIGAAAFALPVLYVEVPDNLWQEIHLPNWSLLRDVAWPQLVQSALVIALVASAETLLCAVAVDQMQQGPRTKYDKELFAQGVGNAVCGCLSALPMTGVIVRSTANIEAGGKSRLSAILHGVWLLVFVSALAFLLRLIPTSCLAGMLVYTGYKLINFRAIVELRRYGWGEVAIFLVTVVTIVVTDLLTGVIVGVVLSAAKLLYTFSHLHADLVIEPGRQRAVLSLAGSATFLRLPNLAAELENVPGDAELHVDFEHLDYIDHACLDLLMNWASQHESAGGRLVIDWESLHARFDAEAAARIAAANAAAGPLP
jgi:MFS superfamily sulfate permease-like transporter